MTQARQRPLSPHLQIYRPQLTSVMSIFHRAAGMALAVGTLVVGGALLAALAGPEYWAPFHKFFAGPFGRVLSSGWALVFFYHLCNGVRHLVWDTVHMLEIRNAYRAGYTVIAVTLLLSLLAWWRIWTGAMS